MNQGGSAAGASCPDHDLLPNGCHGAAVAIAMDHRMGDMALCWFACGIWDAVQRRWPPLRCRNSEARTAKKAAAFFGEPSRGRAERPAVIGLYDPQADRGRARVSMVTDPRMTMKSGLGGQLSSRAAHPDVGDSPACRRATTSRL
jgi:hypothetical protein